MTQPPHSCMSYHRRGCCCSAALLLPRLHGTCVFSTPLPPAELPCCRRRDQLRQDPHDDGHGRRARHRAPCHCRGGCAGRCACRPPGCIRARQAHWLRPSVQLGWASAGLGPQLGWGLSWVGASTGWLPAPPQVFRCIARTPNKEFLLRLSMMEIYNEVGQGGGGTACFVSSLASRGRRDGLCKLRNLGTHCAESAQPVAAGCRRAGARQLRRPAPRPGCPGAERPAGPGPHQPAAAGGPEEGMVGRRDAYVCTWVECRTVWAAPHAAAVLLNMQTIRHSPAAAACSGRDGLQACWSLANPTHRNRLLASNAAGGQHHFCGGHPRGDAGVGGACAADHRCGQ